LSTMKSTVPVLLSTFAGIISTTSAFTPVPRNAALQRRVGEEEGTIRLVPSSGSKESSSTKLSMKLTLYGSQGSRSPLVNWGAYEVGTEVTMGDLARNPHPFGQIPCLTDSDAGGDDDDVVTVFESGAILQYVYSNSKSAAEDPPHRRAAISSWISWANASLDPICFLETPDGKVYDTGLKKPNRRIDVLDTILSESEYLLPSGFSLADVAVASYLLYVPQFFGGIDLSRWPNVVAYMKRCAERPTYGQAFGAQVQGSLIGALEGMTGEEKPKKNWLGL